MEEDKYKKIKQINDNKSHETGRINIVSYYYYVEVLNVNKKILEIGKCKTCIKL